MDVKEIDNGNLALLSVGVPPSTYFFCRRGLPRMVGWQITMADDTVRDVLFSEIDGAGAIDGGGSGLHFNGRTMPLAGSAALQFDDLTFTIGECDGHGLCFVPENHGSLPHFPKISYGLFDLHLRVEISIVNGGTMPLYWRPEVHFFINLPWMRGIPMEKFVVKGSAKKHLRLDDNWNVVGTAKATGRTSLGVLQDGHIGFAQLQDGKIWLGTPNEEEGLSFIFGHRTPRCVLAIGQAENPESVEVAFLSSLPTDGDGEISHGDLRSHATVAPGTTDSFAVELSAY
jgi:hypothetical protein